MNNLSGILFSMLAALLISLQAVFNTQISKKIGLWETNLTVHLIGLFFVLIMILVAGNGSFRQIKEVHPVYLLGGLFGVVIIFSVMKAVLALGVSFSVAVLLVTQLICSALIDHYGWFGMEKISLDWTKAAGLLLMIGGIIVFKLDWAN